MITAMIQTPYQHELIVRQTKQKKGKVLAKTKRKQGTGQLTSYASDTGR